MKKRTKRERWMAFLLAVVVGITSQPVVALEDAEIIPAEISAAAGTESDPGAVVEGDPAEKSGAESDDIIEKKEILPESGDEPTAEPVAGPATEPETELKAGPETGLQKESETNSGLAGDSESETETESEIETEPGTEIETGTETDAEPITEPATEAEVEQKYIYTEESVTVTAYVQPESGIPEDAVLRADKLEKGSPAYEEAYAAAAEALQLAENETLWFLPYDVYFLAEGERIEPTEGAVRVEMQFAEEFLAEAAEVDAESGDVVLDMTADTAEPEAVGLQEISGLETDGETFAIHIKSDGEVEQLENRSEDGQGLAFDVSSFSVMGPAQVFRKMLNAPQNEEPTETNIAYVVLYEDGELVFQNDLTTEPGRSVTEKFRVDLNTEYSSAGSIPWHRYSEKITSVSFREKIRPQSMQNWFWGASKLNAFDAKNLDTSALKSMSYAFYNCKALTSIDTADWDLASVTDMSNAFSWCDALTSIDNTAGWMLTSVTDMSSAFFCCKALTSIDTAGWDLASATDMSYVFYGCRALTSIDTAGWDLASVTDMSSAFSGCGALTSIDTTGWDLASVTDMSDVFSGCGALTSIDTAGWNLTSVTNMINTFSDCEALTSIDNASWNLTSVKNMNYTFYNCKALASIDTADWDLASVTDMRYAFSGCKALTSIDTAGWNLDNLATMDYAFSNCASLTGLEFQSNTLNHVTSMQNAFVNCPSLIKVKFGDDTLAIVTNMFDAFANDSSLESVEFGENSLSAVKNARYLFENCKALKKVKFGNTSLAEVTDMYEAFYSCESLTSLKFGENALGKLEDASDIFHGCQNLKELEFGENAFANVKKLSFAFDDCKSLEELKFGESALKNVTSLRHAFGGCASLSTLKFGSGAFEKAQDWGSAFSGCESLTCLEFGNMRSITNMESTFIDCSSLQRLSFGDTDLANVTTMKGAFRRCSALADLDTSRWRLDALTAMGQQSSRSENLSSPYGTFSGCSSLTFLDATNWGLSSVTDMSCAFYGCSALTEIKGSENWDLNNVATMYSTFNGCGKLTNLGAANWGLCRLEELGRTFYGCASLKELETGDWEPGNIQMTDYAFYGCESLVELDLRRWDLSQTKEMKYMFWGASALQKLQLGPGFRFIGKSDSRILPLYSEWRWVEGEQTFTAEELYQQYDSSHAGTYCRVTDIVFNGNGGRSVPSRIRGYIGMTLNPLPTVTRRGADFDGWWTARVGGEPLSEGDSIAQQTYYAHWSDHHYTLILRGNNGVREQEEILQQKEIPLSYSEGYKLSEDLFTYEGMVLTGWNTRKNGGGQSFDANEEVIGLTEEDGDTVYLYAQWMPEDRFATVAFETGVDGLEIPPVLVESGKTVKEALTELPSPMREHYTFRYWHRDSGDGPIVNYDTEIDGDMTLYAEWIKNPIVAFDWNGYFNGSLFQREVPYNTKVGELPEPAQTPGWYKTMIGWFTEASGGTQIRASEVVTADVTYWAHWGWRPRFNAAGGRIVDGDGDGNYPIQEDSSRYQIEKLPAAERDGYTLDGWYLSDGTTKVNDGDTVELSAGCEIVAHWSRAGTVRITLNPNEGRLDGSLNSLIYTVFQGQPIGELPIPTRIGYEFRGWQDADGIIRTKKDSFSEDTKLTARWEEKTCRVTFVGKAGTFSPRDIVVTVPAGGVLNTLPGIRRSSYILEGWYSNPYAEGETEEERGEKLTTDTVIHEDTTYYARWKPFWEMYSDPKNLYTFGVEWANASNENVDNCEDNLEFHPTDNTEQTAQLHIRFALNKDIASGTGVQIPAGAVQVKIPKSVFKNWDGEAADKCSIANKQLAEYPKKTSGSWFSYKDPGPEYDYFLLLNTDALQGTAGAEITVSYTVKPSAVNGGGIDSNGRYVDDIAFYKGEANIRFTITNEEGSSTPDTTAERTLTLEMHTRPVTTQSKSFSSITYQWDSSWGEKPEDAEDYFYVVWTLSQEYVSGTNQPSVFQWSEEDTVHDGTVVYMEYGGSGSNSGTSGSKSSCKVVTKHPHELLEQVRTSTGLTLYNEAIVTETWKSGYVTEHRVHAQYNVQDAEYPEGEFCKHNYDDGETHSVVQKTGGQENILIDRKKVQLSWELVYDGGSNERPVWNEETQTYSMPERIIRFRDGAPGDLLYSSGAATAPYVWEPDTGNVALSDEDYYFGSLYFTQMKEYDAKCSEGIWLPKYEHTDTSLIKDIEVWVRYKNESVFVPYRTIDSKTKSLSLPDNVVGFEIRHATSFYWTELSVRVTAYLNPTQKMQTLIQSDVDRNVVSIIKNKAICDIWRRGQEGSPFFHAQNDSGGNTPANKECHELTQSSITQFTAKYEPVDNFIF